MPYEFLDANRASVNESEAKDMAGCISWGGVIYAFIPPGKKSWAIEVVATLNKYLKENG